MSSQFLNKEVEEDWKESLHFKVIYIHHMESVPFK